MQWCWPIQCVYVFAGGIVLNWNCFGTELNLLWIMVSVLPYMKKPAAEMVRAVNKFKADFGGHIVSLERVQPSSDHVLHRCVLLYFSWVLSLKKKNVKSIPLVYLIFN